MIWHLYTRRTRGLLAPGRFIASCGEPGKGWQLDSSFEADDAEEAAAIAMTLDTDPAIVSVEVVVDWESRHEAAKLRAYDEARKGGGR